MSYVVKCFVITGIVLAYFIDSFRIKKDITAPANIFTDKPTRINFVMENLPKPQKRITNNAEIKAPVKPKSE